jgi:hypothetical protein
LTTIRKYFIPLLVNTVTKLTPSLSILVVHQQQLTNKHLKYLKYLKQLIHHNYHYHLSIMDDDLLRRNLHLLQDSGAINNADVHDRGSLHGGSYTAYSFSGYKDRMQ